MQSLPEGPTSAPPAGYTAPIGPQWDNGGGFSVDRFYNR